LKIREQDQYGEQVKVDIETALHDIKKRTDLYEHEKQLFEQCKVKEQEDTQEMIEYSAGVDERLQKILKRIEDMEYRHRLKAGKIEREMFEKSTWKQKAIN
jgi:hypothetical protein